MAHFTGWVVEWWSEVRRCAGWLTRAPAHHTEVHSNVARECVVDHCAHWYLIGTRNDFSQKLGFIGHPEFKFQHKSARFAKVFSTYFTAHNFLFSNYCIWWMSSSEDIDELHEFCANSFQVGTEVAFQLNGNWTDISRKEFTSIAWNNNVDATVVPETAAALFYLLMAYSKNLFSRNLESATIEFTNRRRSLWRRTFEFGPSVNAMSSNEANVSIEYLAVQHSKLAGRPRPAALSGTATHRGRLEASSIAWRCTRSPRIQDGVDPTESASVRIFVLAIRHLKCRMFQTRELQLKLLSTASLLFVPLSMSVVLIAHEENFQHRDQWGQHLINISLLRFIN